VEDELVVEGGGKLVGPVGVPGVVVVDRVRDHVLDQVLDRVVETEVDVVDEELLVPGVVELLLLVPGVVELLLLGHCVGQKDG
jgi:hypothetical protein